MRLCSVAIVAVFGLATLGSTPAAAPVRQAAAKSAAVKHAFKVVISPAYATAGQSTTFGSRWSIRPLQGPRGSVKVTPPAGFKPPHPAPEHIGARQDKGAEPHSVAPAGLVDAGAPHTDLDHGDRAHQVRPDAAALEFARVRGGDRVWGLARARLALSHLGVTVLCPRPRRAAMADRPVRPAWSLRAAPTPWCPMPPRARCARQ